MRDGNELGMRQEANPKFGPDPPAVFMGKRERTAHDGKDDAGTARGNNKTRYAVTLQGALSWLLILVRKAQH